MIKSASLAEELFVVIVPGGKILSLAEKIQKRVSDFYNIYKDGFYPQIHITLDRIKSSSKEIERSIKITDEVVADFDHSVKIEID
ncbi:MAG: 2'-5' RNA ligase, partial [bacterium]